MSEGLSHALLVGWLEAPFAVAFLGAVVPILGEWPLLMCCIATGGIALQTLLSDSTTTLMLLGNHGVVLQLDPLAAWFLLLNAVVMVAVRLELRGNSERPAPLLPAVLLGGLNICFVVSDLISLYVALELVGIVAFLLILRDGSPQRLWIGLRYLLISNTAMTLYLVGAALAYAITGSFRFSSLSGLPIGAAQVLLLLGLFTKGGLFLPGLWLPRSHAEAPSDVSALLSAVVVTAGVAPLLRLAAIEPALLPLVRSIGLCSAVLGVLQALSAADLKRLLAWSTVSQMGLVVLSPAAGGALALTHGLAKAPLFLTAGRIRERQLEGWGQRVLPQSVQTPLWLGSLSIAGLPGLAGFAAKKLVGSDLPPAWALSLTLVGIGSVAVYARLWSPASARSSSPAPRIPPGTALLLISLVSAGLILTVVSATASNGPQAIDLLSSVLQTGVVFAAGWLLHHLLGRDRNSQRRSLARRMPQLESLQDLLGAITVVGAGLLLALNLLEVPG